MASMPRIGARWVLGQGLGAGLLLLIIRGIVFLHAMLFQGPMGPEAASLALFQREYPLLHGQLATVATTTSLSGRLVQAWALVLIVMVAMWVLCLLGKVSSKATCNRMIRWPAVIVLVWSSYSACFLPVMETRAEQGQLVTTTRKPHIGNITMPFTAKQRTIPGIEVVRIDEGVKVDGGNAMAWIYYVTEDTTGTIGIVRGYRADQEVELLTAGSMAAAAMERELH